MQLAKPRTTGRQLHRVSQVHPDETDSDYFKRSIWLPYLDAVIMHMQEKFSQTSQTAFLLSSVLTCRTVDEALQASLCSVREVDRLLWRSTVWGVVKLHSLQKLICDRETTWRPTTSTRRTCVVIFSIYAGCTGDYTWAICECEEVATHCSDIATDIMFCQAMLQRHEDTEVTSEVHNGRRTSERTGLHVHSQGQRNLDWQRDRQICTVQQKTRLCSVKVDHAINVPPICE